MRKVILLGSISFLISQYLPTLASNKQPIKRESFVQLCQRRESLPRSTKHTIDGMLKSVGTKSCIKANTTIIAMGSISLKRRGITDLSPLANFPNLTDLGLSDNQISDLRPLSSLTKLTTLDLTNNKITDLKPLATLTNLGDLYLNRNQITDVKPLANLTDLTTLYLVKNRISDVRPLANLRNLQRLELRGNKVTEKDCPFNKTMCNKVYNIDIKQEQE